MALVDDEIVNAHERIKVTALTVIAGTSGPQSAALTLDIDGERVTHQAAGNGQWTRSLMRSSAGAA